VVHHRGRGRHGEVDWGELGGGHGWGDQAAYLVVGRASNKGGRWPA